MKNTQSWSWDKSKVGAGEMGSLPSRSFCPVILCHAVLASPPNNCHLETTGEPRWAGQWQCPKQAETLYRVCACSLDVGLGGRGGGKILLSGWDYISFSSLPIFFFFHFWLCCTVSGVLVLWPEINLQGSPHCPILEVASDGNLNQIEVNMKGNLLPYVMKRPQVWVWWDLGSWAISSGVFVFHHQWVLLCVGFIVQQILPNGNKTAMNISIFPTRQLKLWERGDTCCQQWPQCPETDSYWAILEQMFAHDQSLGPEVWNMMCSPQPRIYQSLSWLSDIKEFTKVVVNRFT